MKLKKYIAEYIGTFFLLFVGTGAIVINQVANNIIGHLGISLAFGFIILILIYACGHISGAHFNPAVTIAFAVTGVFAKREVAPYIISQLLGAVSASVLLREFFGETGNLGITLPALSLGSNMVAISFGVEFIFTALLMFVIMSVATDARAEGSFAGLAIGMTIFVGALVAGPISGGSFNPARSIAPAIVTGNLDYLWLYIVAPVLGAVGAALLYEFLGKVAVTQN